MFEQRSSKKELLDNDTIPQNDLFRNLRELEFINRFLGGHSVVLDGIKCFSLKNNLTITEMGSGGGDNLRAIFGYLKRRKITAKLVGVDLKNDCTTFAKKETKNNEIEFQTADYMDINVVSDILFNSLFTHHFTDEQLVEMLRWMNENANEGFFIGDLHRHPLAYYSIKFLTFGFSKSYLVKNDAPLSVLRGFTKKDWKTLLEKAGISTYSIQWKWAFRHLIIVKKLKKQ